MSRWETLERWRSKAFLVAGGLLVVFAALVGLEVFGGVEAPQALVAIPGFLAGFVGLLGLYPQLADTDSRLASGGIVALGLAAVGFVALFFWVAGLTAMYGIDAVKPPRPVILGTVLLVILGYALFGLASATHAVPSRLVGLLVLAPPGTLALMVLTGMLYGGHPPAWTSVLFSAMQAIAHLAIGSLLWTSEAPGTQIDAPSDSVA